ncbi:MAG: tryptophan--tRNA ligase, partial [Clostridia bacterium]|nr:tryptophan--tRNA ligase [Clostridia bacterium]
MENTVEKKKIVLSAIQPTGTPTLGNYLGALKNWKNMKDDYNCLYAVADLHSLT